MKSIEIDFEDRFIPWQSPLHCISIDAAFDRYVLFSLCSLGYVYDDSPILSKSGMYSANASYLEVY